MTHRSKVIGLLTGTALLVAGCTSTSGGAVTTAVSSSSSSQSATSSASSTPASSATETGVVGTGGAESSGPAATAPGSSAPGSSAPAPATAISNSAASSSPAASSSAIASSVSVSSAAAVLDAASTKWLTTYCTTILPVTSLTNMQAQISAASGDLTKIKALFVLAFRTSGAAMMATAAALKGQSAPALSAAGTDLPDLMSRIGTLGRQLQADGVQVEAIDPVAQASALGTALSTHGPDIDKIATVLGTKGGLKVPAKALPELGRIPACGKVITTG